MDKLWITRHFSTGFPQSFPQRKSRKSGANTCSCLGYPHFHSRITTTTTTTSKYLFSFYPRGGSARESFYGGRTALCAAQTKRRRDGSADATPWQRRGNAASKRRSVTARSRPTPPRIRLFAICFLFHLHKTNGCSKAKILHIRVLTNANKRAIMSSRKKHPAVKPRRYCHADA